MCTDAEHWELLKDKDKDRLNLRTVEVHEYGSTGRLDAKKHYDAGMY